MSRSAGQGTQAHDDLSAVPETDQEGALGRLVRAVDDEHGVAIATLRGEDVEPGAQAREDGGGDRACHDDLAAHGCGRVVAGHAAERDPRRGAAASPGHRYTRGAPPAAMRCSSFCSGPTVTDRVSS